MKKEIKDTKAGSEKEIIALSDLEAIRLRPGMYIGQVSPMDDKIPIIIDGKLKSVEKKWSPGFIHLIVEVIENALDEAKRCKGKMKNIYVVVNLDNNAITIKDEGEGFHNAHEMHKKTKKNVVRTALEELHAGSNFKDNETNIIGMNGVGSAVTNMLSEYFSVTTINSTHYVNYEWKDFKVVKEDIRLKTRDEKLGTTITFIPTREVFPNYKWDKDVIFTYLSYKSFLIKNDPIIKNLILHGTFIQEGKEYEIPITDDFIDQNHIKVETPLGIVYLWESYQDSASLSFVNGSQCTGIHQKIVNDWCNEYFKYNLAHHFYETLISLNVPSKLMRFADQNKTKFATSRGEIEEDMYKQFNKRLMSLLAKSDIARSIETNIEDRLHSESLVKIKRAQKQSKRRISDKYSPPTKNKGCIFLTEGLCIDENQKIFVIRNNKISFVKLKSVKVDDMVLTHENRLKPIEFVNKSIKKSVCIKTSVGDIKCSENHRWFIYDKVSSEFYFEETKNIDASKHQLVKNYLAFLDSFDEVCEINESENVMVILNEKGESWNVTKTNKVTTFDEITGKFVMTPVTSLKIGDVLAKVCIK